jgi:DNA-binding MarR family transcriptional regulator
MSAFSASANGSPAAPAARQPERAALIDRFLAVQPRLRRRFARAVPSNLRAALGGVTMQQMAALHAIARQGGMTMSRLAGCLEAASLSSATQMADRLVKLGLTERANDPDDRRVVRLSLSPRGRSLLAGMEEGWRRGMGEALEGLSDAECARLVELLEKVAGPPPGEEGRDGQ